MNEQSQSLSAKKIPKITTLDLGRYQDSINLPRKLSPTQITILSWFIKKLTFGKRGVIENLNQIIDLPLPAYAEFLNMPNHTHISRAFNELQAKKCIVSTRVKNEMHRQLHPEFIADAVKATLTRSGHSQFNSDQIRSESMTTSGLSQRPPLVIVPLDRRLDEKLDVKLDGRKALPSAWEGDMKTVSYAERIQVAFYPNSFLEEDPRKKFNARVWAIMKERGPMEMEKFVKFIENRMPEKRRNKDRIPQISAEVLDDCLWSWDVSDEKELWDKQFAKLVKPDYIGQMDSHPGH